MTDPINLNKVQQLIYEFAQSKGVSAEQIYEDWSLDYKVDRQKKFEKELNEIFLGMELFRDALAAGDLPTAQCGLLHAGVRAHGISDYFEGLKKDIWRAVHDFDWPEWPDSPDDRGYQVPAHYNYKGLR